MTDFYLHEFNNLSGYKCDQTIIINKKHLKDIWRNTEHTECKPESNPVDWYPLTNSYYPHTEDVDVYERVNHLLSTIQNHPTFKPQIVCECCCADDAYSERSAQVKYLSTKPASYLIIGKPEIGGRQLGRLLAEYWNCVYIEPENLLTEEIEGKTRAGSAIEFNLRMGRAIGVDTVLKLVTKRINTESVKHRGFVLCGLPLVPNELYEEDVVTADSTIVEVRDVLEDVLDSAVEMGVPPPVKVVRLEFEGEDEGEIEGGNEEEIEEEVVRGQPSIARALTDLGTDDCDVCVGGVFDKNLEKQVEFILRQMHESSVIIYMVCSNGDVIRKHESYRFDFNANQMIDLQLELNEKVIYTHFSKAPAAAVGDDLPEDFIDVVKDNKNVFNNNSELRLLVRIPWSWSCNVRTALNRFHQFAMPEIERFVLTHDPQLLIKVDGMISVVRMFYAIKSRLQMLPLQTVAVPVRFMGLAETSGETASDEVNLEGLTCEDAFTMFVKRDVTSSVFRWTWSDWGTKCPVSMVEGYEIDGDPRYAVHFMNKIFFLANEEAYVQFGRNPRPFLLPPWPKPSCRIYVMGPRLSGKSSVAKCLGYVFKATVFNYDEVIQNFFAAKVHDYQNEIRTNAVERALFILNEQRQREWEESERERAQKINDWILAQKEAIKQLMKLNAEIADLQSQTLFFKVSSFPTQLSYKKSIVEQPDAKPDRSSQSMSASNLKQMVDELQDSMDVPPLPFASDYEELLNDSSKLCSYLPEELQEHTDSPLPAIESDEFVQNFVEEALQSATYDHLELTLEHKVEVLAQTIKAAEDRNGCRGGWIIDGVQPIPELFMGLNPNYTPSFIVLLKDDSHDFLIDRYKKRGDTEFRHFRELLYEMDKEEAAWRSPSVASTDSYRERTINFVIEEILEDVGEDNPRLENITTYNRALHQFDADFTALKPKLVEYVIDLIEVSVSTPLKELLIETVRLVANRYRQLPTIFTDLDRIQEVQDFGASDDLQGEEEVGEEEEDKNNILENRRYGDTFHYCPVTFANDHVLWKGKETFVAKFQNKVYTFTDETALNAFITDPFRFLPIDRPCVEFPPPRICIVGPQASGKSVVADRLCRNFGLYHYKYSQLLKSKIAPNTLLSLRDVIQLKLGDTSSVTNYFYNDDPLEGALLSTIIEPLWLTERERKFGFILSGFPKRVSDLSFMVEHRTIPDVIIELKTNRGDARNRLIEKFRYVASARYQEQKWTEAIEHWHRKRTTRLNDLSESVENADEIDALLARELPEPRLVPPDFDGYANEMEDSFMKELEDLQAIREQCRVEEIPWVTVDASVSFVQIVRVLDKLKFRNESLFERVYVISVDLAEKLLRLGYYFLSRFGKWCPVQIFEGKNPVQMYLPSKEKFELSPCLHRQYIYFIARKKDVEKFKMNPLKYTRQSYTPKVLVPFRLAIIGPPKSGKTSLAERFRREFGFQHVTRGKAGRYVLNYLSFSELAETMDSVLRFGWELSDELLMKAVKALVFDARCITQGIVMDGFPDSTVEVLSLSAMGLVPHLVIHLQADLQTVRELRAGSVGKRYLPAFNETFIHHRYEVFEKLDKIFHEWFQNEYQSHCTVRVGSKWSVWNQSCKLAMDAFSQVQYYFTHASSDLPLKLSHMLITPLEFIERQSSYKHYCPCCLYFDNILVNSGSPPDRTRLVQFRHYFYFICNSHANLFLTNPLRFISPYNPRKLPDALPIRPRDITQATPYSNGDCIVCYTKNIPRHVINPGSRSLSVTYREKTYLFDTEQCLELFMGKPLLYFSKVINYDDVEQFPALRPKDLPIPGYLQQYDVKQLIRAINNTRTVRPVIPGLNVELSAAIYLGLYLKVNNPKTPTQFHPLYKEAQDKFNERRTNLLKYLDKMKTIINPYLYYDEPLPRFSDPLLGSTTNSTTKEYIKKQELNK